MPAGFLFLNRLGHERSGEIAERDFRANLAAIWRERHITDISQSNTLNIINDKCSEVVHLIRGVFSKTPPKTMHYIFRRAV
jgi:hypothetical protein